MTWLWVKEQNHYRENYREHQLALNSASACTAVYFLYLDLLFMNVLHTLMSFFSFSCSYKGALVAVRGFTCPRLIGINSTTFISTCLLMSPLVHIHNGFSRKAAYNTNISAHYRSLCKWPQRPVLKHISPLSTVQSIREIFSSASLCLSTPPP